VTKIIVNGREVEADPKKPLIEACHLHGHDVPTYCYHPGLTPRASCRVCQVEVQQGDMPPRVVVACKTPVAEGMVVNTEAPKALETRRECVEFLLKNHPLDCPICDKAGECDLQDFAFDYGQSEGRTSEPRRKLKKRVDLGEVILHDQERCILCGRCARYTREISKTREITIAGLGSHSVVTTFEGRPLTGNYQGNLADVCPVGALTLKAFRFQARVWNLKKAASTCAECSRGCAITAEVLRDGPVRRFRPRYDEAVNQWWMCDTGRFAFERVNAEDRLGGALIRGWTAPEAAGVEDTLAAAAEMLRARPGAELVLSPFATLEEGQAALALARALDAKAVFVSPPQNELKDDFLHTGDPCPNRRGLTEMGIEGEEAEAILERLAAAPGAVLVGERVVELLGAEALAALPGSLRLLVFDTRAPEAPTAGICIGVPTHVEKSGHWLNLDGHRRLLTRAKAPPEGVRPLEESLERLVTMVGAAVEEQAR